MHWTRRVTFVRGSGGRVHFAKSAVAALMERRQLQTDAAEAGGIMLGRLIADSLDVVVDEVVGPLSQDKRSRFAFFRPRKQAQQIVDRAWATSRGTRIFLGEWHTHPEDDPQPSPQDSRNWRRICERAVVEQEFLLFMIVGRKKFRLWEVLKGQPSVEIPLAATVFTSQAAQDL